MIIYTQTLFSTVLVLVRQGRIKKILFSSRNTNLVKVYNVDEKVAQN